MLKKKGSWQKKSKNRNNNKKEILKILFTHGYFLLEDEKEQTIMRPYPPLGILYLSAWLDKHGHENQVFDTTFSKKNLLKEYLLKECPKIIAIYTNLMTKINVIEIVDFIRAEKTLNKAIVVLGGPDVRYNTEDYLKTGANIAVIGEGEETIREIVEAVESGEEKDFSLIDGLAFIDEKGELIQTKERKRLRPVDDLPFPNRHKMNMQQYLDTLEKLSWQKRNDREYPTRLSLYL